MFLFPTNLSGSWAVKTHFFPIFTLKFLPSSFTPMLAFWNFGPCLILLFHFLVFVWDKGITFVQDFDLLVFALYWFFLGFDNSRNWSFFIALEDNTWDKSCELFRRKEGKEKEAWQEVERLHHRQNRRSCSHIQWKINYQMFLIALPVLLHGVSSLIFCFLVCHC